MLHFLEHLHYQFTDYLPLRGVFFGGGRNFMEKLTKAEKFNLSSTGFISWSFDEN